MSNQEKFLETENKQAKEDLEKLLINYVTQIKGSKKLYNKQMILALFGVLGGIISAVTIDPSMIILGLLAFIFLISAIYSAVQTYKSKPNTFKKYLSSKPGKKYETIFTTKIKNKYEFTSIHPHSSEEELEFMPHPIPCSSAQALMSKTFNIKLSLKNNIHYQLVKEKKPGFYLKKNINQDQQLKHLVAKVKSQIRTTNNEKVSLVSNLNQLVEGQKLVDLRRVSYFDGLLTSEAFRSQIHEIDDDESEDDTNEDTLVYDLTEFFPAVFPEKENNNKPIRLKDNLHDYVSGHIGITTICITNDNNLVFYRQAKNNAVGGNKYTSPGSGSMDFQDLRSNERGDLILAIKYAMARELCEESKLIPYHYNDKFDDIDKIAKQTQITGFFRWVNRCGKPEFIGVTKLKDYNLQDLEPDNIEVRTGKLINNFHFESAKELEQKINQLISTPPSTESPEIILSTAVALKQLSIILSYSNKHNESHEYKTYEKIIKLLDCE